MAMLCENESSEFPFITLCFFCDSPQITKRLTSNFLQSRHLNQNQIKWILHSICSSLQIPLSKIETHLNAHDSCLPFCTNCLPHVGNLIHLKKKEEEIKIEIGKVCDLLRDKVSDAYSNNDKSRIYYQSFINEERTIFQFDDVISLTKARQIFRENILIEQKNKELLKNKIDAFIKERNEQMFARANANQPPKRIRLRKTPPNSLQTINNSTNVNKSINSTNLNKSINSNNSVPSIVDIDDDEPETILPDSNNERVDIITPSTIISHSYIFPYSPPEFSDNFRTSSIGRDATGGILPPPQKTQFYQNKQNSTGRKYPLFVDLEKDKTQTSVSKSLVGPKKRLVNLADLHNMTICNPSTQKVNKILLVHKKTTPLILKSRTSSTVINTEKSATTVTKIEDFDDEITIVDIISPNTEKKSKSATQTSNNEKSNKITSSESQNTSNNQIESQNTEVIDSTDTETRVENTENSCKQPKNTEIVDAEPEVIEIINLEDIQDTETLNTEAETQIPKIISTETQDTDTEITDSGTINSTIITDNKCVVNINTGTKNIKIINAGTLNTQKINTGVKNTEKISTESENTEKISTGTKNTDKISTGAKHTEAISATGTKNIKIISTRTLNTEKISTGTKNNEKVISKTVKIEPSTTTSDVEPLNSYIFDPTYQFVSRNLKSFMSKPSIKEPVKSVTCNFIQRNRGKNTSESQNDKNMEVDLANENPTSVDEGIEKGEKVGENCALITLSSSDEEKEDDENPQAKINKRSKLSPLRHYFEFPYSPSYKYVAVEPKPRWMNEEFRPMIQRVDGDFSYCMRWIRVLDQRKRKGVRTYTQLQCGECGHKIDREMVEKRGRNIFHLMQGHIRGTHLGGYDCKVDSCHLNMTSYEELELHIKNVHNLTLSGITLRSNESIATNFVFIGNITERIRELRIKEKERRAIVSKNYHKKKRKELEACGVNLREYYYGIPPPTPSPLPKHKEPFGEIENIEGRLYYQGHRIVPVKTEEREGKSNLYIGLSCGVSFCDFRVENLEVVTSARGTVRRVNVFRQIQSHIKSEHLGEYNCPTCNKKCKSYKAKQVHVLRGHLTSKPEPRFPCTEDGCSQTFRTFTDLRIHKRSIHKVNFVCRFCREFFSVESEFHQHQNNNSDCAEYEHRNKGVKIRKPYSYRFILPRDIIVTEDGRKFYQKHEIRNIGENDLQCATCELHFEKKKLDLTPISIYRAAINHIKGVHLEVFKCEVCDMKFKDNGALQRHHHFRHRPLPKNRKCQICERPFSKSTNALKEKIHLWTHKSEDEKNEAIAAGENILPRYKKFLKNREKRKKKAVTPIKCKTCSKEFRSKIALNYHEQLHLSDEEREKHLCSYCGKSFKFYTILRRHILRVHENKLHYNAYCKLCPYKFYSKSKLVIHMRTHTGEKPFSCPYCGDPFGREDYVRKHILCCEIYKSIAQNKTI